MKFALASLLAVTSADFAGCQGSDWGQFADMKTESDCIFNKLSSGSKSLGLYPMFDGLKAFCDAHHYH